MPNDAKLQQEVDALRELASQKHRDKSRWYKSLLALVAGNVADVSSSWGQPEANRILAGRDGRFGAKGLAIKSGIVGGTALAQYLLGRKYPEVYKVTPPFNIGVGVGTGAIAANNIRLRASGK